MIQLSLWDVPPPRPRLPDPPPERAQVVSPPSPIITPDRPLRAWQAEALPICLAHIERRDPPALLRAVTGAGKSILLREICRRTDGRIVVTTPSIALVEQLAKTLAGIGEPIGRWYTHDHSHHRVDVVCEGSIVEYSAAHPGPRVWIADEAHRTETARVLEAHAALRPEIALGVTATPYRADDRQRLTLWQSLIYDYGPARALADGVIVPLVLRHWDGVGADDIDAVTARCVADAVALGPTIVSATSVADAEQCVRTIGARARAIHAGLSQATRERILDDLRTGELDAVVHVALLVEGVDYPWLRCLVLRRPTKSRVRLVQEIGRIIRADEDKPDAHVWDIHDVLGSTTLDTAAVLGGESHAATEEEKAAERTEKALATGDVIPKSDVRVIPLDLLTRTIRSWAITAEQAGESRTVGRWRNEAPTDAQIAAIGRMSWAVSMTGADPGRRDLLRRACATVSTRGGASDLLTVLKSLANARSWHPIRYPHHETTVEL